MAFKTLKTEHEPITLEALAERIEQRRVALGREIYVPRNSGNRRTPSKLALLAEIAKTGVKW